MTKVMTRAKISATVDRELLARAHLLTGITSVSELLDRALAASVAAEIELQWQNGYGSASSGNVNDDLGEVTYGELGLE